MNNNFFHKKSLALAVSTASMLTPLGAMGAAEAPRVEEVIVTATARAQSVQDIPFNISAVDGAELAAQNIVEAADLMRSVSGVSMVDRGHRNSGTVNSIVIRGMNVDNGANGDIGLSAVPTVSTYVDGTPLYANFLLKDIERVEVLRGPQGTLYGSGALAGTVRYIMNKPSTEAMTGKVTGGFSQTNGSSGNNINTDVVFNLPLSDKVAMRLSAGTVDNAGVVDYENLYRLDAEGIPLVEADDGSCRSVSDSTLSANEIQFNGSCYTSKNDADDVDIWYARAALGADLSDDVNLLLTYQAQEDKVGGRRAVTTENDFFGNPYGEYGNGSTLPENSKRDAELISLNVEANLGFATLTSNTSNYDHNGSGWRDNTSLWVSGGRDWYNAWYTGNPRPASHVEAGFSDEALVQEFRLVSNSDSDNSIDWVAGVYYMDQDRTAFNLSHLRGLREYGQVAGGWWANLGTHDRDFTYIRNENFKDLALYGEITVPITDTLRITGGLRWFDNELTNQTALDAYYGHAEVLPFEDYPTQSEDGVLKKLNVSWDMTDSTMLYFTYSEGFRRGGSNAIPTSGPFQELNPELAETYGKDAVDNYEIGIKGGSDRIRYSADIYYVDWQDPQLNTTTWWWKFFMAQNGESAKSQGLELEAELALSDSLNLTLGYAYNDSELDADLVHPQSGVVVAEAGRTLPGTAEHVTTLALSHSMALDSGIEITSRLSAYHQTESTNMVVENSALEQTFEGFAVWNASVAATKDNWTLSLYGKNLANEKGTTGSYPGAYWSTDTGAFENYYGNNQKEYIIAPRTLGMNLSYDF